MQRRLEWATYQENDGVSGLLKVEPPSVTSLLLGIRRSRGLGTFHDIKVLNVHLAASLSRRGIAWRLDVGMGIVDRHACPRTAGLAADVLVRLSIIIHICRSHLRSAFARAFAFHVGRLRGTVVKNRRGFARTLADYLLISIRWFLLSVRLLCHGCNRQAYQTCKQDFSLHW